MAEVKGRDLDEDRHPEQVLREEQRIGGAHREEREEECSEKGGECPLEPGPPVDDLVTLVAPFPPPPRSLPRPAPSRRRNLTAPARSSATHSRAQRPRQPRRRGQPRKEPRSPWSPVRAAVSRRVRGSPPPGDRTVATEDGVGQCCSPGVHVCRGPACSGKSTLSIFLARHLGEVRLCMDDIRMEWLPGSNHVHHLIRIPHPEGTPHRCRKTREVPKSSFTVPQH